MARSLAIAYATSVLAAAAMVLLARGLPSQAGPAVFYLSSFFGLLLLPAAVLFFNGARRSSGLLRKVLAYGMSAATALIGLGSAVSVILVLVGGTIPG